MHDPSRKPNDVIPFVGRPEEALHGPNGEWRTGDSGDESEAVGAADDSTKDRVDGRSALSPTPPSTMPEGEAEMRDDTAAQLR